MNLKWEFNKENQENQKPVLKKINETDKPLARLNKKKGEKT